MTESEDRGDEGKVVFVAPWRSRQEVASQRSMSEQSSNGDHAATGHCACMVTISALSTPEALCGACCQGEHAAVVSRPIDAGSDDLLDTWLKTGCGDDDNSARARRKTTAHATSDKPADEEIPETESQVVDSATFALNSPQAQPGGPFSESIRASSRPWLARVEAVKLRE